MSRKEKALYIAISVIIALVLYFYAASLKSRPDRHLKPVPMKEMRK